MSELGPSVLAYLRDPRLSAHALSPRAAWLWSLDGTRLLWANPIGAALFGASDSAAATGHAIDPKSTAALQVARLVGTLSHSGAPRLERLRGFGIKLGGALICACSRATIADRTTAMLLVATEPAGPNLSLAERARRALAGTPEAAALFAPEGTLLSASETALAQWGPGSRLAELGVADLAHEALASGRTAGTLDGNSVTVERIGANDAAALLVIFPTPDASSAASGSAAVEHAAAPPPPTAATATAQDAPVPKAPLAPVTASTTPRAPASPVARDRRPPLRFLWQMDAEARFTISSDEFLTLIGPRIAATLGRAWSELDSEFRLDPEGQIARAFSSQETWSGIVVPFPVDGADGWLAVELSGLPVFDRDRNFRGYRGFGVCRDVARVAELARAPRPSPIVPPPASTTPAPPRAEPPLFRGEPPLLVVVPPSENVVPFRSSGSAEKPPMLTPVERKAFRDLANRLSARLHHGDAPAGHQPDEANKPPLVQSPPSAPADGAEPARPKETARTGQRHAQVDDQRPLLDRLPVGLLVYRLDSLIYANRAFLEWTDYRDLDALEQAGGLDALFLEPGSTLPHEDGAKSLVIATNKGTGLPVEARLFSMPWDGESALVLMLSNGNGHARRKTEDTALLAAALETRDWRAILDTATDGVVVLDGAGLVQSVNHSAEVLFGYPARELAGLPVTNLFTPDSQDSALDYLALVARPGGGGLRDTGRELTGRAHGGSAIPLFMTAGRLTDGTDRLCAVFRDLSAWRNAERDLIDAKRQAENASAAKSDFLAKVSHEIRTPLGAIIGFAEVMMQERFGPIGNERYRQYLKDIHTSGGHLISLLNDLLDLSKIEAGKLNLSITSVDLNELTRQSVALMQEQANRQRIIIRTSLAPALPPVLADARSVCQILLNLLSNSIKFTGAGGQVIVSTALNDGGEAVLRVRDTGVGMSAQDIAVALEPFRQLATAPRWGTNGTGLGLPLTKALAEANRASFNIRSAVNAGTLVEVAFPRARVAAE